MKFATRICLIVLVLATLTLYTKSASAFSSSEFAITSIATPIVPTGTNTQMPSTAVPTSVSAITNHVQRIIYDAKNGSTLPGTVVRKEGDPQTGDVVVDDVYDSIGELYDFFLNNYKRDSINNKGMVIQATVHYLTKYSNTFWNGKQLVFGDGDGDLYNRVTTPDLIAQTYVVGITQHAAELKFSGQPGALNISFGDVFASLFKQNQLHQTASAADWIIGAGAFTSKVNGIGLRSLKAPGTAYNDPIAGKDPQSAHMKDYVNTTSDNGGIHINSGIPNHAFYIVAIEIGGYAWEKAGKIWYITLQDKLRPDSDFQDAATQTFIVAGELYGVGSSEQEAVRKGWAEVGIPVYPTNVATPIAPPPGDGCLPSLLGVVVFGLISFGAGQTSKRRKSSSLQ